MHARLVRLLYAGKQAKEVAVATATKPTLNIQIILLFKKNHRLKNDLWGQDPELAHFLVM